MSRCIVGSQEGRAKIRNYFAILRVVNTPKGRMYRAFPIPSGRITDIPVNTVTLYCAWCKKPRSLHAKNQCLFAPTKFRPYTVKGERTGSKERGYADCGNVINVLEKARV